MFQLPSGGAGLSPLKTVTAEWRRNDWGFRFSCYLSSAEGCPNRNA